MSDPILLPAMDEAQAASWHALMELYLKVPENWALVGGQLVHLHCAERSTYPTRPTTDVDAVVNIRADPKMLARFTLALVEEFADLAEDQGVSFEGCGVVSFLVPQVVPDLFSLGWTRQAAEPRAQILDRLVELVIDGLA